MSVARLVLRCEAGAFLVDDSFQYRTLLAIYVRSGGPSYFLVAPFPDGSLVSAAESLWGLVYDLLKGLFCGLLARDSASLAAVRDRSARQS